MPLDRSENWHRLDGYTPCPLPLWEKLKERENWICSCSNIEDYGKKTGIKNCTYKQNTLLWADEPLYCKAIASPIALYIFIKVIANLLVSLILSLLYKPIFFNWRPNAASPKAYCATFVRSMQSIQFVRKTPHWNSWFAWCWPSTTLVLEPLHTHHIELPYLYQLHQPIIGHTCQHNWNAHFPSCTSIYLYIHIFLPLYRIGILHTGK